MSEKEFTAEEVKQHTDKKDLYLVVHGKVYNASNFLDEHPGGEEVIIDVAGKVELTHAYLQQAWMHQTHSKM